MLPFSNLSPQPDTGGLQRRDHSKEINVHAFLTRVEGLRVVRMEILGGAAQRPAGGYRVHWPSTSTWRTFCGAVCAKSGTASSNHGPADRHFERTVRLVADIRPGRFAIIFAIQEELAASIAATLRCTSRTTGRRTARDAAAPRDLESYQLSLKGQVPRPGANGRESAWRSVACFEHAQWRLTTLRRLRMRVWQTR